MKEVDWHLVMRTFLTITFFVVLKVKIRLPSVVIPFFERLNHVCYKYIFAIKVVDDKLSVDDLYLLFY